MYTRDYNDLDGRLCLIVSIWNSLRGSLINSILFYHLSSEVFENNRGVPDKDQSTVLVNDWVQLEGHLVWKPTTELGRFLSQATSGREASPQGRCSQRKEGCVFPCVPSSHSKEEEHQRWANHALYSSLSTREAICFLGYRVSKQGRESPGVCLGKPPLHRNQKWGQHTLQKDKESLFYWTVLPKFHVLLLECIEDFHSFNNNCSVPPSSQALC